MSDCYEMAHAARARGNGIAFRRGAQWLMWVLLVLLPCAAVQAQEAAEVSLYGRLMNAEGESVPGAVVLLVRPRDSSIACYSVTDSIGRFVMRCQAEGPYWLQSHVMGYLPQSQHVLVPSSVPLEVSLMPDPKEIEAVRIEARRKGVRVLGDTVKYNLKAFTTGAERTLGELLANLPGIKVAEDGTVMAQGQKVEKIMFNGRDLYGSNVALATKNVSADVADSVKVVHGYSEYSLLNGFQNHEETVIDVGVNESMWGKLSGEIEGGAGYKWVYGGRGNAMYMGKNSMFSAVIAGNNTGEKTFTFKDYIAMQGGLPKDESGIYRLVVNGNDYLYRLTNPPKDTYAQRTELVSLNYTYSKGDKLKVQTAALYSGGENKTEQWTTREYMEGPDRGMKRYTSSSSATRMQGGAGVVNVTYHPSERFLWQYGAVGKYSRLSTGYDELERFSDNTVYGRSSNGWQHPFELQQRFVGTMDGDLHQLQVSLGHDFNASRSDSHQTMDRVVYPFSLRPDWRGRYNLERPKTTWGHTVTAGVAWRLKVTRKQFIQLSVGGEFDKWHMESQWLNEGVVPQLQPGLSGSLATNVTARRYGASTGVKWSRNKGRFQFTIGAVGHWKTWQAGVYGAKSVFYVEPDLALKMLFSRLHQLWFVVEGSSQLVQNERLFAQYEPQGYHGLYRGRGLDFPFIKSTSMTANYLWYAPDGVWNLYCMLGFEFGRKIQRDVQLYGLSQVLSPWDLVRDSRLWSSFSINRTFFAFWNAGFSLGIRMFETQSYRVAGKEVGSDHEQITSSFSLQSTYKSMFNMTLQGTGTYYRDGYGDARSEAMREWSVKGGVIFKRGPVRAVVQSGWRVSPFGISGPSDVILEGDVSYDFWKDMSLVLVGHDVLHMGERNWADIQYGALYRTIVTYRRIPGNVQLKLRWKFGEKKSDRGDINVQG